jgi:CubicO group peptidase (beta-lactamase class C family)
MNNRVLTGAIAIVMLPAAVAGQQVKHGKQIARIDSVVQKAMRDGPIPGMSIAVARGKETIVAKGYGYANLTDSTPATAHTVYPIASITKQFTAAAVMQLIEADSLELKGELSRYLPEFRSQGQKVTVKHLLSHTSGIPNDTRPDAQGHRHSALEFSPAEFIRVFDTLPRDFPPGEKFSYSNSGYYLLGLIIEKISGKKYASFVHERLFEHAQMNSSGDCNDHPSGLARGYDRPDTVQVPAQEISGGRLYAAAGLCSTVLDLVQWQKALKDRKIVNAFSWNLMKEPAELKDGSRATYGFGTVLGHIGKHRYLGHGGSVPGFSSQLAYYPDDELTIVVLANSEQALTRRIADQIAIIMLGIIEPKVKDLPLAAADLDHYLGTFDLAGEALNISAQGGKLLMRLGGGDGVRLLYQGSNEFVAEPDPSTKIYFRMSHGEAKSLQFSTGELTLDAKRKDE